MSWLLTSQLVLGLLVAVTTGLLVLQMHQQALTAARHQLRSLALTLADQAERAFEAVDLVQTTFMEMARVERPQTPDEFRRRMSTLEVNQQLVAHVSTLPQVGTLGLADPDGMIINFGKPWPLPAMNSVADRKYFQALRADPGLTRVISDPLLNYWNHLWTVVVAHSVISQDGQLLAVGFAGVEMIYFEKLYQTVVNDEDTAISLFQGHSIQEFR